jgi:hypothetical protein
MNNNFINTQYKTETLQLIKTEINKNTVKRVSAKHEQHQSKQN